MKKLRTINKLKVAVVALAIVHGCVVSSCRFVGCEECTEETKEELRKISDGDVSTYKRFMQKHKDPYYSCCNRNSIIDGVTYSLENYVRGSDYLEIITDYFKYDLSQKTKNDFMHLYWKGSEYEDITRFLIAQGCKVEYPSYCDSSFLEGLKKLHKLGYDMNHIDPNSGRNLFLQFSAIGYEQKEFRHGACAVECLKYLQSIGVDTKLKDIDGKTALELASDPVIIEYLKGIQ